MSEAIEIVERPLQHALAIEVRTTTFGIPRIMGQAYHRIMAVMEKRGLSMQQPPYTLYKHVDWEMSAKSKGLLGFIRMLFYKWEMEIAIPVAEAAEGEGEVIATSMPAGRYLHALHRGPYKTVSQTYDRMQAYLQAQNLKAGDFAVEIYLNDPRQVGEAEIETEVLVPLAE